MEYITTEEFLKKPKEIQEVFLKWWKNNMNQCDLIYNSRMERIGFLDDISMFSSDFKRKLIIASRNTPLLTEGQLRQFIEDKINHKFDIYERRLNGYHFKCIDADFNVTKHFETNEHDLLQAYWKVAIEVAKGGIS